MALFNKLKRAFGFSDAEMEEVELEGIDARVTPLRQRLEVTAQSDDSGRVNAPGDDLNETAISAGSSQATDRDNSREGERAAVPSAIFETVVKVFNESLPPFISGAVDENAQREYLYKALDTSMQKYLESLAADAERACAVRWENERTSMRMQMETLRRKSQKDEEECSGSKKLQLSAERQKRALTERVHDLEKQLDTLQAENEQYVLENKSLVNKLRLNSVLGTGADVDKNVAERLAETMAELEKSATENTALKDNAAQLEQTNTELKARCEELQAELEKHMAKVAALEEKDENSESVNAEMQRKFTEAMQLIQEKEMAVAEANKQLAGKDSELNEALRRVTEMSEELGRFRAESAETADDAKNLKEDYDRLVAECNSLRIERDSQQEQLNEAMENMNVIVEMQQQLEKLEESRRSNESFVRSQKDELMRKDEMIGQFEKEKSELNSVLLKKDETIRALEDMTDSLRKTIENNLYEHAQAESAMRSEIERLKTRVALTSEPASDYAAPIISDDAFDVAAQEKPRPSKRKGASKGSLKISAIDETLEDTDWLIATPPPSKKKEGESDDTSEFGYKEPARKATPDNPAQMSLW